MDFEQRLARARSIATPGRLGVRLQKRGRNLVSTCPFHEPNEESLCFFDALGTWKYRCLRCGASGDLVEFYVQTRFAVDERDDGLQAAIEFWDGAEDASAPGNNWLPDIGSERVRALEILTRYCNLALERSDKARDWLAERGWTIPQAQIYGLGFYGGDPEPLFDYCLVEGFERHALISQINHLESCSEPCITVPARNSKGIIHAVYGRTVSSDSARRYLRFASGPGDIPFNIQPDMESPIIVDSIFDTLTADLHGVPGVVSLAGGELSQAHILKLKACGAEQIAVVLERNGNGRHGQDQMVETGMALAKAAGLAFKSVLLPRGLSVASFIRQSGGPAFLDLVRSTEPDTSRSRRRSQLLQEIRESFEDSMAREPESTIGYRLDHFPKLQQYLDGVQPGYYLISAHPFGGKTALLLNLALDLVDSNPVKLIFVTLEMPRRAIFHRMVSMSARLSVNDVQRRSSEDAVNQRILRHTMDLMGMVKADRLEIWDDLQVKDEATLHQLLREEHRHNRNLVVCIDGLYHLKAAGSYDGSEIHERRSQSILDIYKELDIPVFCTSELVLRKEVVDGGRAPGLVDITGPRAYVRDPLVIMFLSASENGLTLTLAKNRVGGRPITMPLFADSDMSRIEETKDA